MGPPQVDLVGLLRKLAATHGDFVRFPLGAKTFYLCNRPAYVRLLFIENVHKLQKPAFMRDSNRGYWGDGLTTEEGARWRDRRALLRPAFRAEATQRHLQITAACTEEMLSGFRPGSVVRLRHELRALVARIAARSLFDADVEGIGPLSTASTPSTASTTASTPSTSEARRPGAPLIRFEEAYGEDFTVVMRDDPTSPLALTRPRAPRRMDSTLEIIDARLRSREDRGDMLSFLIRATFADGSRLTRDEIIGEIIQMLYAGHLTVPLVLSSFWFDLSQNPSAARRVHVEAARVSDGLPSAADDPPAYCEAALKESMRLHAPAPILFREVAVPFAIDDHTLEAGAGVWVSPQLLHLDPRNFPEPERFRPERFDRDQQATIPECAYLPFGTGPRTCIGNRLALAQMAIIASLIARRFRLIPQESTALGERFEVALPA